MTRDIDVSTSWTVTREQIGAHNDRELITAEHDDTGASVVVKEQPNGIDLQLRIEADLPGGFDTVHDEAHGHIEPAIEALERYASKYDETSAWTVGNAPIPQ